MKSKQIRVNDETEEELEFLRFSMRMDFSAVIRQAIHELFERQTADLPQEVLNVLEASNE